jgi:hypothetical protein
VDTDQSSQSPEKLGATNDASKPLQVDAPPTAPVSQASPEAGGKTRPRPGVQEFLTQLDEAWERKTALEEEAQHGQMLCRRPASNSEHWTDRSDVR